MKRIYPYILCAAAILLAAASCTIDDLQTTDGSYISLKLSSKAPNTKATMDGVDDLNENAINTVYYFFYEKGDSTSTPVVKGRLLGVGHKGTDTTTEEIPVASDVAGTLFAGTETECQAFIIANPPKSMETTLQGTPTLNQLLALTLVTTLTGTQESFTMVYNELATKSTSTTSSNIMTVEAEMQRIASKMTFAINTSKTCTDAGSTWTSNPDKAKVTFYNAFKKANLAGNFEAVKTDTCYFNSDVIAFDAKTEKDEDTWHNEAENPAYSYPETWDFTGAKEPYALIELPWTKSGETTPVTYYYKVFLNAKELKMNTWCHLIVNIDKLGSLTPEDPAQLFDKMTYMVLNWNDAFESEDGITAEVEDTRYLMLNKKTYTIYNQEDWDIPYTSSHDCTIKDISYTKINYINGAGTPETVTYDTQDLLPDRLSINCNGLVVEFHHDLINNINLTTSDAVPDGAYDVAPYTIEFTICHNTDDPDTDALYAERISVTQYPAIYIQAEQNSRGATIQTGSSVRSTAFVNILDTDNSATDRQTVRNDYGGDPYWTFQDDINIGNKNGYMYVLTTTTAPDLYVDPNDESTLYIIGDPRKLQVDDPWNENNGSLHYRSLPWLGSSRTDYQPSYYYRTVENDRAANVIAPKLRVASSWGQTISLTFKNAARRCAAYQEDGYPAGRWRMPTAAELMYICKLSEHHMIPMLYGSARDDIASYYWCSTGFVEVYRPYDNNYTRKLKPAGSTKYHKIDDSYQYTERTYYTNGSYEDNRVTFNSGTTKFSVRCVYDEWYWENTSDEVEINGVTVSTVNGRMPDGYYNVRIWGDRQR